MAAALWPSDPELSGTEASTNVTATPEVGNSRQVNIRKFPWKRHRGHGNMRPCDECPLYCRASTSVNIFSLLIKGLCQTFIPCRPSLNVTLLIYALCLQIISICPAAEAQSSLNAPRKAPRASRPLAPPSTQHRPVRAARTSCRCFLRAT